MVSNRAGSAPVLDHEPDLTVRLEQRLATATPANKFRVPQISSQTKMRLKILVSVVMFASLFLFGKIDLSKSWEIALHANLWFLGSAVVLFLSSTLLNGYRWQLLANAVGLRKPFFKMVQFCFVGLFFNLFLPSTVGGDFSRCYYLSKGTGRYGGALYSVLADRAVGIAVLFLFATLGILLGPGGSEMAWTLKAPIFLGTLGIFGVVPFMPKLTTKILGEQNWITKKFNDSTAKVYWRDKNLIGVSLGLSVLLQVVLVTVHILIGYALGLTTIPLWYYFVFYPSVAVLGFITPSFNGIGIREWAYTYFLTMAGIDRSHALTYAIMWLGLTTFTSLFGGIVYVAGHFKISKEEAERMHSQAV
jgi:glycosyltransferase 2 family protein